MNDSSYTCFLEVPYIDNESQMVLGFWIESEVSERCSEGSGFALVSGGSWSVQDGFATQSLVPGCMRISSARYTKSYLSISKSNPTFARNGRNGRLRRYGWYVPTIRKAQELVALCFHHPSVCKPAPVSFSRHMLFGFRICIFQNPEPYF